MRYFQEWTIFILVLLLTSVLSQLIADWFSYVTCTVVGFTWGVARGDKLYGRWFLE